MNCRLGKLTALAAAAILALSVTSTASAQVFTGRIDVTVQDQTGGRLPGVTVDLTGPVNQTAVTDELGQAHFLNLAVGNYTVKANLAGFSPYTNDKIQVTAGQAVPIEVKMGVAGTSETVNVTSAVPIIDSKRETTTTNVTLQELQQIPSARDPWVVMQTVPSIYVDRVNVGGSESGQQSNYIGKGAFTDQNTWYMDGVPITDMGATGSSPTYYNFDEFQEMAVTTGGADAAIATAGVQLNMVLKKGTNVFHGDAATYWEGQSLQATNLPADLAARLGGKSGKGNRTDKYLDSSVDLGGPIVKDRLWAWGNFGRTDVRSLTLTGTPDATLLKNPAVKVDGQISDSIRANFTWFEGNKTKNGRNAGPTRPPETTWNQTGPTNMYKEEGNFVLGQKLFLAARYAYISGGFSLIPQGGDANVYQDAGGVWHGSYQSYVTKRPQYYGGADGSYFVKNHEVKFGFTYRKTPVDSSSVWPGTNHTVSFDNGYPSLTATIYQPYIVSTVGRYRSLYATDTITMNRLTVIAGLRYDRQTSSVGQTQSPAIPGVPLLPAKTVPAIDNAFLFNTVTPRVGVTWALNESRRTVMRASYAMFAAQLPAGQSGFVSPAQYSYVSYDAIDLNGDHIAEPNEILFNNGPTSTYGFDPSNPGALTTPNKVAPNVKAPRTQEALVGFDHELMQNFAVGATFTYRYMNDFLWSPPVGATRADYVQTGALTGTFANVGSVSVPYYGLSAAAADRANFGFETQNRPDYHQRYMGLELSATKRMSNHWMARFGFSTNTWQEFFDAADAILDPTPTPAESSQFRFGTVASGPLVNGGQVVVSSSGSGKSGLYLVAPQYQFTANGLYQFPWGIDVGANLVTRQGYAEPWYRSRVNTRDAMAGVKSVLIAPNATSSRLSPVTEFDARVAKQIGIGKTNFTLMFDVFNLLNNATTLGVQYDARVGTYNQVLEIQNPRIARLGIRFNF